MQCKFVYIPYYHLLQELREGNAFTVVCLFTGGRGVGTSHASWTYPTRSHPDILYPLWDILPPDIPLPWCTLPLLLTSGGHVWR